MENLKLVIFQDGSQPEGVLDLYVARVTHQYVRTAVGYGYYYHLSVEWRLSKKLHAQCAQKKKREKEKKKKADTLIISELDPDFTFKRKEKIEKTKF